MAGAYWVAGLIGCAFLFLVYSLRGTAPEKEKNRSRRVRVRPRLSLTQAHALARQVGRAAKSKRRRN